MTGEKKKKEKATELSQTTRACTQFGAQNGIRLLAAIDTHTQRCLKEKHMDVYPFLSRSLQRKTKAKQQSAWERRGWQPSEATVPSGQTRKSKQKERKQKKIVSSRTHQVANDDEVPSAPCRTRRLKVNKQKSETHKQDANEKILNLSPKFLLWKEMLACLRLVMC